MGRQQIVWGKTDFFRSQDIVNPLDLGWHGFYESWGDSAYPSWQDEPAFDTNIFYTPKNPIPLLYWVARDQLKAIGISPEQAARAWTGGFNMEWLITDHWTSYNTAKSFI